MLLYLVGPIDRVSAAWQLGAAHQIESEDVVNALIGYASGATGVLQASTALWPGYPERIEIHGTKGFCILATGGDKLTRWDVQDDSGEPAPIDHALASGASDPMAISTLTLERQFLDFGEACATGRAPVWRLRDIARSRPWLASTNLAARRAQSRLFSLLDSAGATRFFSLRHCSIFFRRSNDAPRAVPPFSDPRCVLFFIPLFIATGVAESTSRFCADANCTATRQTFKSLCDYIVKEKATFPTIYVGGYYMRDLVAGYEIFGDRRYLRCSHCLRSDYLLSKQMPNGFWATGYGPVYLADTGSALGLFIVLYKHVDPARQRKYFDAVERYTNSLQNDGMILPSGAFGTGWKQIKNGVPTDTVRDQYTLSSALTGATIFTWMYH